MRIFANQLERLLDISKFDAGVIKPEVRPYNLAEVFDWLDSTSPEPPATRDCTSASTFRSTGHRWSSRTSACSNPC